jgi:hypothetical protein
MKEINEFESWADTVTEGTWAVPDTPAAEAELKLLMSKPLPVGADATNATEQLYDLIGDDELFDQLADLAARDANADARPVIQARLAELGIELDIEPVQAENLDTDGVMMVKPSNMSSESIDPLVRLRRML